VKKVTRSEAERMFSKGIEYTTEELEFRYQHLYVTTFCLYDAV